MLTLNTESSDLVAQVRHEINQIVDPCSRAAGTPVGLVDMGIVRSVEIFDGSVRIELMPTFSGCLFAGVFSEEAQRRIEAIAGCDEVVVEIVARAETWTEDDMSDSARQRLEERRRLRRRALELIQ